MFHVFRFVVLGLLISLASVRASAEDAPSRFVGDVGSMTVHSSALVRGVSSDTTVLPYVYGDWGRLYGRVDTFGVRTLAMGEGHLELAMRVTTEGFKGKETAYPSLGDRSAPLPMGLGTFQRLPWGGVFAYLMHDPRSGGQFAELTWAGKFVLGPVNLYPQLGGQYRSSAYVNHLYGVSASESATTGLARWQPGASWAPQATLQASLPLTEAWSVQAMWRRRWLDSAISNSPLVQAREQTTGWLALTYTLR